MVRRGQGEARDSVRRLESEVRQRTAWQLRLEGKTLDQIVAAGIGYSDRRAASRAVDEYRKKVLSLDAADLSAWVDVHMARLESIIATLWPQMLRVVVEADGSKAPVNEVNVPVIDAILRVLVRQAKLLGLDAADQRADREVAINEAIAERFLAALTAGISQPGITDEQREAIKATVLEVLRAPVLVAPERN